MILPDIPFVIPFFIPHAGCPHQCSFCNQRTISGQKKSILISDHAIEDAVNLYLGYSRENHGHVQLAFFGGNFLGMGESTIRRLLDQAGLLYEKKMIHSIRFSTRPDTVTPEMMSLIRNYPVKTIEIGTQSMDPLVLHLSKRGHSPEDTSKAAAICRSEGYETGIQIMIGLPGEDESSSFFSGKAVSELSPDFVRIYPTVVVDGSPLAESFRNGEFIPLETAEAVKRAKKLYLLFKSRNIRVIRMGLQATDDLIPGTTVLAGPYHPAFGHLVLSSIFHDRIMERLAADFSGISMDGKILRIVCNSKSISRVRGNKNENIKSLQIEHNLAGVLVNSDPVMSSDDFHLSLVESGSKKPVSISDK